MSPQSGRKKRNFSSHMSPSPVERSPLGARDEVINQIDAMLDDELGTNETSKTFSPKVDNFQEPPKKKGFLKQACEQCGKSPREMVDDNELLTCQCAKQGKACLQICFGCLKDRYFDNLVQSQVLCNICCEVISCGKDCMSTMFTVESFHGFVLRKRESIRRKPVRWNLPCESCLTKNHHHVCGQCISQYSDLLSAKPSFRTRCVQCKRPMISNDGFGKLGERATFEAYFDELPGNVKELICSFLSREV